MEKDKKDLSDKERLWLAVWIIACFVFPPLFVVSVIMLVLAPAKEV